LQGIAAVPGLLLCLLFVVPTLQMDEITFHRLLLMCHFHLACAADEDFMMKNEITQMKSQSS